MTVSVADSVPEVGPVKVIEMVQFAPAAREVPQVFVCEKSVALGPVREMLVIVKAEVPLLVSVAVCGEVPKLSVLGARVMGEEAGMPVPVSETVCGLLESLSEMLKVADSAEVVVGVKVML